MEIYPRVLPKHMENTVSQWISAGLQGAFQKKIDSLAKHSKTYTPEN